MNELAERAIENELALVAAEPKEKLARLAEQLQSHRGDLSKGGVAAFARAEVSIKDPLQSRRTPLDDAHGVGALLSRGLGP